MALRPRVAGRLLVVAAPALVSLFSVSGGCEHWKNSADHLDTVAAVAEEYGTASVTEPLLLQNTGQFEMNIDRPVKEYIDAARINVQGSQRSAELEALSIALGTRFNADLTGVFNPLANKLAAPSTQPYAVPTSSGSALPTTLPATAILPAFTALPGPSTLPSTLSERQLLSIGVNDKATEVLLRNLFNPQKLGANKKLFIGILQVSCQPGWRTRRGYVADIGVTVRYAMKRTAAAAPPATTQATAATQQATDGPGTAARRGGIGVRGGVNAGDTAILSSDQTPGRPQPLVLCAFPSVEAQTLDLQSNLRSRISTALALSALLRFGPAEAQSDALLNHALQLERDANTRTAIPIVTSYSNGAQFGYQIRPAFQAIGDLTDKKGRPAEVLEPVSFPAVVLLVCDKDDLDPKKNGGYAWDNIEFYVSSRWLPSDPGHRGTRLSERKRLEMADAMDEALDQFQKTLSPTGDRLSATSYRVQELGRRVRLYESVGLGITRYSALPDEAHSPGKASAPQITGVYPKEGWANAATAITVVGHGFTDKADTPVVKQVLVGGVPCTDVKVVGEGSLVAVVPAGSFAAADPANPPGPQEVVVLTSEGHATSSGATITFPRDRRVDQPVAQITVVRTPDGRLLQLAAPRDGTIAGDKLLAAVQSVLQGEALTVSQDKLIELLKAAVDAGCCPQRRPVTTRPCTTEPHRD